MKKIIYLLFVFTVVFLIYYKNIDKTINYLALGDYLVHGINNSKKVEISFTDKVNKYLSRNNKVDYKKYVRNDDYRIVDLYNDIVNNKKIIVNNKAYTIKQLLIKSDILILSIGMNDMYYQKNISNKYNYVDELLIDLDKLLKLIRKNCKEEIYLLNYYNVINNEKVVNYTNKKLASLATKYEIKLIDISNLNEYLANDIYPTNAGYNYIYKQIKQVLQN